MFSEQITALFWALPVVLVVGAGAILLLKRLMPGWMAKGPAPAMRQLADPLVLSEHTTIYWVEVQGRRFVVAESSRSVCIQTSTPYATHQTRPGRTPWTH